MSNEETGALTARLAELIEKREAWYERFMQFQEELRKWQAYDLETKEEMAAVDREIRDIRIALCE